MNADVALFWAVVAGFLVADNLLLLPVGGDFLQFGRKGTLRYDPRPRLQARGRDLVWLNPLDLFHRAVRTSSRFGPIAPAQWRTARRTLRRALPRLNAFAWIGYAYLAVIVALAVLSIRVDFAAVLMAFLTCHLSFWLLDTALLLLWRDSLGLSRQQAFSHAAEALFVPAYTLNLGKRLWYRQSLDLPALSLGVRQLKRLSDPWARELYVHELGERLGDLEIELANQPQAALGDPDSAVRLHHCLQKARSCLTT